MDNNTKINQYSQQGFTKRELLKLIEENFPDDKFGLICTISTVHSENGKFQTVTFGKILDL